MKRSCRERLEVMDRRTLKTWNQLNTDDLDELWNDLPNKEKENENKKEFISRNIKFRIHDLEALEEDDCDLINHMLKTARAWPDEKTRINKILQILEECLKKEEIHTTLKMKIFAKDNKLNEELSKELGKLKILIKNGKEKRNQENNDKKWKWRWSRANEVNLEELNKLMRKLKPKMKVEADLAMQIWKSLEKVDRKMMRQQMNKELSLMMKNS